MIQDLGLRCPSWPASEWWADRDRICLLHEYIELIQPPDGTLAWEDEINGRAYVLWRYSDDRTLSYMTQFGDVPPCTAFTLKDMPAPGWRLLTSLACCPHSLRPKVGKRLLNRIRAHERDRRAIA